MVLLPSVLLQIPLSRLRLNSTCILAQFRQCHSHYVVFCALSYRICTPFFFVHRLSELCLCFGSIATAGGKEEFSSLQVNCSRYYQSVVDCCSEKQITHTNKGQRWAGSGDYGLTECSIYLCTYSRDYMTYWNRMRCCKNCQMDHQGVER